MTSTVHPITKMTAITIQIKTKPKILQSAAALVLAFSSSHAAFLPPKISHFSQPLFLKKPALNNKSLRSIQQLHYSNSSTVEMSFLKDNHPDNDIHNHLVLPYEEGPHGSAKIVLSQNEHLYESLSIDTFKERLQSTVEVCKELKKKSLWLEVPISKARFIEACSDIDGLEFHHATGKTAHLSLWLRDDVDCMIPEFATHQIGVGAIVVNSRDEILCVREIRRNYRPWKIPGGLAELGEQLNEAAEREVMEETGIPCRFKSVLGFRHTHGMQFGRSDIYFVCILEPEEGIDAKGNPVIPEPVAQESEIAATAWVPLQEYKDMINGEEPHRMMQKMISLYEMESDIQKTVINSIVPGRKPSPVYHAPEV